MNGEPMKYWSIFAVMLLNKITRGHTPQDVSAADSAEVLRMMKASAMGAAGMGVPDEETQVTFSRALAQQSKGAYEWNVTCAHKL